MNKVTLFASTGGLNNVVDGVRAGFDPKTGVIDLIAAVDIDIDQSGRISRRRGFTATSITGNVHSVFQYGAYCLLVKDNDLFLLNNDWTLTGLRNDLTDAVVDYCGIGNTVYYCNGYEKGLVLGNASYVWEYIGYVGPSTSRQFSSPPIGHLLATLGGRIYVAKDDVVWFSEPFGYTMFDLASNYLHFEDRIRILKSNGFCLWVGGSFGMYCLIGRSPKEFEMVFVSNSPVVEGSATVVPGNMLSEKIQSIGSVVIWTAEDGVFMGYERGQVRCVSGDRLVIPSSNRGTGAIIRDKYVCLMEG